MSSEARLVRIGPWEERGRKAYRVRPEALVRIYNETAYDTDDLAEVIRVGAGYHPILGGAMYRGHNNLKKVLFEVRYFTGSKEDMGFSGKPMVKLTRESEHDYSHGLEVHSIKLVRPKNWAKYVGDMEALEAAVTSQMPLPMVAQLLLRANYILNKRLLTYDSGLFHGVVKYLEELAKYVEAPKYGEEPSEEVKAWRWEHRSKMLARKLQYNLHRNAKSALEHNMQRIKAIRERLESLEADLPGLESKVLVGDKAWRAAQSALRGFEEEGLERGMKP